jgi:hypothetical protein
MLMKPSTANPGHDPATITPASRAAEEVAGQRSDFDVRVFVLRDFAFCTGAYHFDKPVL